MSLTELFEVKNSVCRDYVIRLADRVPSSFHIEKAIEYDVPLFMASALPRSIDTALPIWNSHVRTSRLSQGST